MSAARTVGIFGATGETGRCVLTSALASPAYSRVIQLGRRSQDVPPDSPGFDKLASFVKVDFDKLLDGDAAEQAVVRDQNLDAVLITLGTTRANAGSFDNFVRIDREYVIAAAKAARVEGKDQSLVYLSSGGSSSSSFAPYPRSKGLTEEALAALGYSRTIIFRPGLLAVPGGRKEKRTAEAIAAHVTGFLSRFTSAVEIPTPVLGAAIAQSGASGEPDQTCKGHAHAEELKGHKAWSLNNSAALKLGQQV